MKTTGPIKIGIAGSRFAAKFHLESYRQVSGVAVDVVGVYSKTKESREAFAREHGVKAFESFDDLVRAVDVVDLCVPGYQHEPMCVRAAELGKHVIIEKPFTGAYGPGMPDWRGDQADKKGLLEEAVKSVRRMLEAAAKNRVKLMYAENWVYAPSIQKEVAILRATKGQILWIHGEESHSGSTSSAYGDWKLSGGGSLVGKGCHPLTACLYLKRVEGIARQGRAIHPKTVSCRTHSITRNPAFADRGHLRTEYKDIEDFVQVHLTFADGMVADIFSSELVMGGVHNWMEIYANNHRMRCNINPTDANLLYNPVEAQLKDVYLTEKLGTKQGWSFPSPDENWMTGYPQELQDFMECIRDGREPQSDVGLAADTVTTLYAAYVSAQDAGRETVIPQLG
ncbi:MAG: Gfo/Idh/MocA family oxidoreductase [Verrucomicrobia bacterium]|nr:Gfo/Idh/MocA family oxidoreductase [Verrucomicrobiota bacterium]MCG2678800.1 Gfo/Idh/MocA family oxidoreductase [Kiritimatiellia bacterium]MBU4246998.1 Gfo/Idh/MocA family oxidoreductase [Verrucomicrobiota bacterium]MBU4291871.1 Gfo/Idh/MocA family oxidoreductase [Verrucomicrobiota bacterium]MBU4427836.1 Gfo/Idh/MocA family oxidoreductase [Verrucomicrobiota bacterium]